MVAVRKRSGRKVGRERVEPELIDSLDDARRLQLLINGVIDYAIYLISPEGRVVSWNAGAQRLKGYHPSEIIGRPYATFFTPEDRERGLPQQALDPQAAAREVEENFMETDVRLRLLLQSNGSQNEGGA